MSGDKTSPRAAKPNADFCSTPAFLLQRTAPSLQAQKFEIAQVCSPCATKATHSLRSSKSRANLRHGHSIVSKSSNPPDCEVCRNKYQEFHNSSADTFLAHLFKIDCQSNQPKLSIQTIMPSVVTHSVEYEASASENDRQQISVADMYHCAFLRWISKRQIKPKTGVLHNRRTKLGTGWPCHQDVETLSEPFAALGINIQHTSVSWAQQSRIEQQHPAAKYHCYSESKLRWSWTLTSA